MTDEQRKLIEDNQLLVRKFMVKYHLNDDDIFQELIAHLCSVIDKYEPEKGAFSTWVFMVCENEMHHIHKANTRSRYIPQELISSLDAPCLAFTDGDSISLEDTVQDERSSAAFDAIEAEMVWKQATDLYEQAYPKSAERDLAIFRGIVLREQTTVELANTYGITKQAINLIFHKTRRKLTHLFLDDKKKHDKKRNSIPQNVSANKYKQVPTQCDDIIVGTVTEEFNIKKSILKILKKWIYLSFIPTFNSDNKFTVEDLRQIAAKEFNCEFSTNEIIQSFSYCGFRPMEKDKNGLPIYYISEKSPIMQRIKCGG